MWLVEGLTPDHKVISEFRRLNLEPLKKLFKVFVRLCREWDLVGGELEATDGTKVKASNNKKNNFSRKKLNDRLKRLDEKIDEYLTRMEEEDNDSNEASVAEGLYELLKRKELYEGYKQQLDKTGEDEISTVDPDARLMGNNRGGVDVAYNVQSTVDSKSHIILEYDVTTNPSDHGQLSSMTEKLIKEDYRDFTALADKGYYNGEDLSKMNTLGIKAVVSRQRPSNPKDQPAMLHTENFKYDKDADLYTCPTGQILHAHSKKTAKRRSYFNKEACSACPHKDACTRGKNNYRCVSRGQYAEVYEEADKVFQENLELYKQRQQLVEHPFGTIKHTMNGGYFLLRTLKKVSCEVALLCLGYNLKRAYNVLGFDTIMAKLDCLSLSFLRLLGFFVSISLTWLFFIPRSVSCSEL